jgi:putative ABC transport system permease protein
MFDLEKAIQRWRETLRRNESLEEAFIVELESHLRDEVDRSCREGASVDEAFRKAAAEIGQAGDIGEEFYKTYTSRLGGRPPWKPGRSLPALLGNSFKIVLRRARKSKAYSLINIAGLAVGLACCILIVAYILTELSYDGYHKNASRIVRLGVKAEFPGTSITAAVSNTPAGPALVEEFPEVLNAVRFRPTSPRTVVSYGDRQDYEGGIFFADRSVFDVFTFPMLKGDPRTALEAPGSLVITASIAAKYFGDEDPLGKVLRLNNQEDRTVTGVIADVPKNSHFTFNMLLSFESLYAQNRKAQERWLGFPNYTYLLLGDEAQREALEAKLPAFVQAHMADDLKAVRGTLSYFLQPLTRIHLHSRLDRDVAPQGSVLYVYIFAAVALFILLLACINFVNLSTARASTQAREIGVRKACGASRRDLIRHFLAETFAHGLIALAIALGLSELALSYFSALTGVDLRIGAARLQWLIPSSIGLLVFVGVAAGSYPAFLLSAYRPARVLKGDVRTGVSGSRFRDALAVFQFAVSISLIIGTGIIMNQLRFMKTRDPGFRKEDVVIVRVMPDRLRRSYPSIKARLGQAPGVLGLAATSTVPGIGSDIGQFVPEGFGQDQAQTMDVMNANADFLPTMGIKLVDGRNFSAEDGTEASSAVLINRTAARKFGWDAAVGKTIRQYSNATRQWEMRTVVGVVEDFQLASDYRPIAPLCIGASSTDFGGLVIRLDRANVRGTLATLNAIWKDIDPDRPFDYFFLEAQFDGQYRSEERLWGIMGSFAVVSIVIACLGLFGMTSFAVERRTKEIGIRKILGASAPEITLMLAKESAKRVLLANLVAWPVTYFVMAGWLRRFAYRDGIGIGTFVLSTALALLIAMATVGWQAVRAATADPVQSLRYE